MKFIFIIFLLVFNISVYAHDILAKSWLIADGDGAVIEEFNTDVIQPIASITKLMTAIVILDKHTDLDDIIQGQRFRGLHVTRRQLLDLAIVHSDNVAADLLCKTYVDGYKNCIQAMNDKAIKLNMSSTEFYDSTGLDNRNVSKSKDLVKLLQTAEKYPIIVSASSKLVYELVKRKKKNKIIKQKYSNTNPLVGKYNVIVSKTGYVRASGGCLVMSAYVNGKKRLFVVLNSTNTRTRIKDMEKLIIAAAGF